MKKVMIVLGAALFVLASCAKDYTCKCTVTDGGVAVGSTSSTINGKKKDVETQCNESDASVGTLSTDCEIVE